MSWEYHGNLYDPVANWPLDDATLREVSGRTPALPLTVETGTYRAADIVPGLKGVWGDGSTVLVENTGDARLRLTGDFTVAFYIRPTRYPAAGTPDDVFTVGTPDEGSEADNTLASLRLEGVTNQIGARWETTGQAEVEDLFGVVLVTGVPYWVALRREGLDLTLFLAGAPVETWTAASLPSGGSNAKFRLFGGSGASATTASEVVLSSVVVYNKALNDCQVSNLFEAGSCPEPVLTATQLGGFEGPIDGGTPVSLVSTMMFDFAAESDAFDAASLSALWSNVSSGGSVYATPNGLHLHARGSGAATQTAAIRSLSTFGPIDATFNLEPHLVAGARVAPLPLAPILAYLALRVDASNVVRLAWRPGNVLNVSATVAGKRVHEETHVTDRPVSARIVRESGRVLGYANGERVLDFTWLDADAALEVGTVSSLTAEPRDRVDLALRAFTRRPVFTFGGVLAPDALLLNATRAVVVAPPWPDPPATVDLRIRGALSSDYTIEDAFRYTLGGRLPTAAGRNALYVLEVPDG